MFDEEARLVEPTVQKQPNLLLNVLDEERGSSQVVNGEVKKALDFFLVKIHSDDMS